MKSDLFFIYNFYCIILIKPVGIWCKVHFTGYFLLNVECVYQIPNQSIVDVKLMHLFEFQNLIYLYTYNILYILYKFYVIKNEKIFITFNIFKRIASNMI